MPFSKLSLTETRFQIKAVVYHLESYVYITVQCSKFSFKLARVINMLKTKVKSIQTFTEKKIKKK